MVFDRKMIEKLDYDDLFKIHKADCIEQEKYEKSYDEKKEMIYKEALERFKKEYWFVYIDPEKLTEEEKVQLNNAMLNLVGFDFGENYKNFKSEPQDSSLFVKDLPIEAIANIQELVLDFYEPKFYKVFDEQKSLERRNTLGLKISREDIKDKEYIAFLKSVAIRTLEDDKKIRIAVNQPMLKKDNKSVTDYVYTKEDMEVLIDLNNTLAEHGMDKQIVFNERSDLSSIEDFDQSWDLEDVIKANNYIDDIVDEIKKLNLSPFETMIYIHGYVTKNFAYKKGLLEECRVLPGIIKTNNIVCSGYSSFVKAIIDKLDSKYIKCDLVGCQIYKKAFGFEYIGAHCHNVVKIVDPQYGINGTYIEDACWDAKRGDSEETRGFAHCLYSVNDLKHLKHVYYVQEDRTDRFSNLLFDVDNFINLINETNSIIKGKKGKSQFIKFIERANKIRKGSSIARKYKNESSAIDLKSYIDAMIGIQKKIYGEISEEISEKINNAIKKSISTAMMSFDDKAMSCFKLYNIEKFLEDINELNNYAKQKQ